MQTYTHYVMTAVINRQHKAKKAPLMYEGMAAGTDSLPPVATWSALLGSVMPDIPLTALAVLFLAIDQTRGAQPDTESEAVPSLVGDLFRNQFFTNRWVKLAHNLFHAPILTILYTLIGYLGWKNSRAWGPSLFWFGAACTLHTAIDIPLHHDDGPLIFFPLDWETRVYSPVSYWDRDHYGAPFAIFEHLLLIAMLVYLGRDWLRRRTAQPA